MPASVITKSAVVLPVACARTIVLPPTTDHVTVFANLEDVVASAAIIGVFSGPAVQRVVATEAAHGVIAAEAVDRVVARCRKHAANTVSRIDSVVGTRAVDSDAGLRRWRR